MHTIAEQSNRGLSDASGFRVTLRRKYTATCLVDINSGKAKISHTLEVEHV